MKINDMKTAPKAGFRISVGRRFQFPVAAPAAGAPDRPNLRAEDP
jgi:hypothetical protein